MENLKYVSSLKRICSISNGLNAATFNSKVSSLLKKPIIAGKTKHFIYLNTIKLTHLTRKRNGRKRIKKENNLKY